MSMAPVDLLLRRVAELERRLGQLETLDAGGLLGTDQTIKGCHDRLDSLLGAGKSAPDGTLVSNFNADKVDGKDASELGVTDHGALTGLSDDDHIQYLKEEASGGAASEVPDHTHADGSQCGTVDHGALTGLADDDHSQYLDSTRHTKAIHDSLGVSGIQELSLDVYVSNLSEGSPWTGAAGPGVTKSFFVEMLDAAATALTWTQIVPVALAGAEMSVTAYWQSTSSTGNFRVQYNYNNRVAADDVGAGSETTVTETTAAATNLKVHTFATNITMPAAGGLFRISFRRLGTDGADTCTGNLKLFGLSLKKV